MCLLVQQTKQRMKVQAGARERERETLPEEQSFILSWKAHPDGQVGGLAPPTSTEQGTQAGRVRGTSHRLP